MTPKILVVDDAVDTRTLFEQAFKRDIEDELFSFIYRYSAEEALEYLDYIADSNLLLVMTDINLPGASGLSLLKIIKEKHEKTSVFVFTAYDDSSKRQLALDYKAEKYITKPLKFSELRSEIHKILKIT